MDLVLRETTLDDLAILFEHQRDPVANKMAVFGARGWDAFVAFAVPTFVTATWAERLGLVEIEVDAVISPPLRVSPHSEHSHSPGARSRHTRCVTEGEPVEVVALAEAYLGSRCLHVAVDLGLADAVADDPRELFEVAGEVGANAGALMRIVRHLAVLGVFEFRAGRIWHNEASRSLRTDDPGGKAGLIKLLGLPVMWDSFSHLEAAVRTGRPGTEFVDPAGFFAYLDAHPGESDAYDRGMTAMTARRIARTVPHYDFTPFEVIADIGGGRGHLLRAVLEAAPKARGVIFDRAQVVDDVAADPRIEVRSGTFFTDALPTADCYLLSNIIHDWSDQDAVSILTAVRAAASPSSTLLLFEWVVPDDGVEFEATDVDVFMLGLVGGRERTLAEYADLLGLAGWQVRRTVETPAQTIIEATTN